MMKSVFTVSAACQNLRTLHGYNVPPAWSGSYHSDTCVQVATKFMDSRTPWHCYKCMQ